MVREDAAAKRENVGGRTKAIAAAKSASDNSDDEESRTVGPPMPGR